MIMRSAFLVMVVLLAGCPRAKEPAKSKKVESQGRGEISQADDEVRPVYPMNVKPDPLAQKLCGAIQALPEERRAACCSVKAETGYYAECVRMLSGAFAAKAVKMDAEKVAACQGAMARQFAGCGWVGPWTQDPPTECLALFQGQLPEKARCRSSLECRGNMRCHGVGPTATGTCGPPRPVGEMCGTANDPLAVYTRQEEVDREHPECTGYCNRGHCAKEVALGAACKSDLPCGPGAHCLSGSCVPGGAARVGEACMSGGCESGARCIDGQCRVRKDQGAACEADTECRGACVVPDGGKHGTCGMNCKAR